MNGDRMVYLTDHPEDMSLGELTLAVVGTLVFTGFCLSVAVIGIIRLVGGN